MILPPEEDSFPLLSIQDLQTILMPHARRLGRCVWPIWDRYLNIPEGDRFSFDLTAEANVLNRYMIDFAKREFADVPGVQFPGEDDGFILLLDGFPYGIDGQAACRFKKLDTDGRSKNNLSTRRSRAVRSNDNGVLDDIPPRAAWTDIGYVLNGLRTGIAEVQAIRVADTAFIMSIPRDEGGTITLPGSLDEPPAGSGSPRLLGGPSNSRFLIFRRKEQGSDDDPPETK